MQNKCIVCGEKTIKQSIYCANCLNAKKIIQQSASKMLDLHGILMATGMCEDCGTRPATCRDHRHYSAPLKVSNVCGPCNIKRGPALDLVELIKAHRGITKPSDLVEIDNFDDLPIDLDSHIQEIERKFVYRALKFTHGNVTNAAKVLGITFRAMRYKIIKHGLKV